MKLLQLSLACVALAIAAAPAWADPDGKKIGHYLIVSPLDALKAQETWDLSRPIDRHDADKPGALVVSTARESRTPAQSDWIPAGLIKVARSETGQPLVMRLWTRKGGPLFVQDVAEPGAAAAYKINVGHDSFVLTAGAGGAIEVNGDKVGTLQ
jgi:hypothetical protein